MTVHTDATATVGGDVERERVLDQTDDGFVTQCRLRARELSERKMDQEQRLAALIEGSFGQLEQIFNSLFEAAKASEDASHAQFEEASAALHVNLDRHEQVETKLRTIMSILLGSASQQ